LTDEIFDSDEFEFLDPEFADFSGSVPLVLKAADLSSEINFSYRYLQCQLSDKADKKGCIALCGYSLYELEVYAMDCGIPMLNGSTDVGSNNIFLSDAEKMRLCKYCIITNGTTRLQKELI
jgi:hypothetical protein